MDNPRRHRSFFWPTILIGVGVVWLLVNFGVIASFSINTVLQFWPLLLVLLGLDILFGRRYAWVGSVIGILAIGAVIAFLVLGPKTGSAAVSQMQVDTYSAPLDGATSVKYDFETASEPVEIYALTDTTKLIDASIAHQGTMSFIVGGTTEKSVHLFENSNPATWLNWNFSLDNPKWNIGLNPSIPTDLTLSGGSGSINADLSGIQLKTLNADLGSGSSNFTLPKSGDPIKVILSSGSGSVNLDLPADTNLTVQLDSGSGSVNIGLPADAAVRVELNNSGSGSLNLPNNLARVSGEVETGAWETPNYAQAANRILIQILDQGSGSISIN